MIAAFLKNADGDFDIPALAIALPSVLFALYMLCWWIPRAIHRRRVLVTSGAGQFVSRRTYVIERDKTPGQFWFWIGFYFFGVLLFFTIAFMVSFGLMREQH
jgi:hypothetical protein